MNLGISTFTGHPLTHFGSLHCKHLEASCLASSSRFCAFLCADWRCHLVFFRLALFCRCLGVPPAIVSDMRCAVFNHPLSALRPSWGNSMHKGKQKSTNIEENRTAGHYTSRSHEQSKRSLQRYLDKSRSVLLSSEATSTRMPLRRPWRL